MKVAYFDCFAGVAGDMALGALLDCGVPLEALREGLKSLPVEGWDIETTPVLKSGIHGLKVRITLHGQTDAEEFAREQASPAEHHHDHTHSHDHDHDHTHSHSHAHENGHAHHHEHDHHEHAHTHEHHHGRSMAEIRDLIESSQLPARVKQASLAVFWRIAEIEAKMHHSTPEAIHFHEIGGLDSMLDIIGVCWCLDYLGVEDIYCSALPASTGWVDCAHGRMPIPAPATQELLLGVPMVPTDIKGEMVTPTGAGLMVVLSTSFGAMPPMTPEKTGFGAGTKDWPDRPNLVRVVIGETTTAAASQPVETSALQNTLEQTVAAQGALEQTLARLDNALQSTSTPNPLASDDRLAGLEWRTLQTLECNIDDMNPEFFGVVFDRLFAAGALDVWVVPLQMKKSRPAWQLGVLCDPETTPEVLRAVLCETTTLGVRVQDVQRAALPRQVSQVATNFGDVGIKIACWPQANLLRATPEYNDVERLAHAHGVPARDVYQAALGAFDRAVSDAVKEKQNASSDTATDAGNSNGKVI